MNTTSSVRVHLKPALRFLRIATCLLGLLIAILVAYIFVPSMPALSANALFGVSTHEVNLGSLDQGTKAEWQVTLENFSNEDISITSLTASCTCLKLLDRPSLLSKKSKTVVKAYIDTHLTDGDFIAALSVGWKVSENSGKEEVVVRGHAKRIADFSVTALNYGTVGLGSESDLQFNVMAGESELRWTHLAFSSDKISCTAISKGAKDFAVTASLKTKDDVIETIHDKLAIAFLNDKNDIVIKYELPVFALVKGDVVGVPPSIYLGEVGSKNETVNAIKVHSRSDCKVKFISVAVSNQNLIQMQPVNEVGNDLMMNCKINPTGIQGAIAEKAIIHVFTDKEYIISIPVVGYMKRPDKK